MRLAETDEYQCCPVCAIQFKVTYVVPFLGELRAAHVPAFRLPTYDGESVDVVVGTPSILVINGRLDLFASEAVEQAIALLPGRARSSASRARLTSPRPVSTRCCVSATPAGTTVALQFPSRDCLAR